MCFAALVEFTEADEALADQALLGDVFLFMKEGMLGCETFCQEEFYIRRLHSLITDFLALMPMKVRQWNLEEGALVSIKSRHVGDSLISYEVVLCVWITR